MELKFRLPLRVFGLKRSGASGVALAVLSSKINHTRYVLIKLVLLRSEKNQATPSK